MVPIHTKLVILSAKILHGQKHNLQVLKTTIRHLQNENQLISFYRILTKWLQPYFLLLIEIYPNLQCFTKDWRSLEGTKRYPKIKQWLKTEVNCGQTIEIKNMMSRSQTCSLVPVPFSQNFTLSPIETIVTW